jgi:hypothetical protein
MTHLNSREPYLQLPTAFSGHVGLTDDVETQFGIPDFHAISHELRRFVGFLSDYSQMHTAKSIFTTRTIPIQYFPPHNNAIYFPE